MKFAFFAMAYTIGYLTGRAMRPYAPVIPSFWMRAVVELPLMVALSLALDTASRSLYVPRTKPEADRLSWAVFAFSLSIVVGALG